MPKATVGAIIFRENNKDTEILLTKRNIQPFKDYWCFPGGHIDEYETTIDAIIREVKEETNMDFKPRFFGFFDEIFPEIPLHNVVIMHYGKASNVPKADPVEVSDIGWFKLDEALEMKLAFHHNDALTKFANSLDTIITE